MIAVNGEKRPCHNAAYARPDPTSRRGIVLKLPCRRSTWAASRVTRSPRRTNHSSVLSHLPIRVAQQCNGRERGTDTPLMTSGRDKQKDTYVKRDPSKNVGKVGAKAR